MIAIPGIFCEAMATRYKGKAMVNTEARLKVGWTNSTVISQSAADTESPWLKPIRVKAKTIATGDAQSGANQYRISQTAITGNTNMGYSALAAKGATQKLKITPANIALAIDLGIAETTSPSFGHRPVSANNRPQSKMPPMALLKPMPLSEEPASRAAPGVDQTTDSGILKRQLSSMESAP
jgi:hypothetical protein